MKDHWICTHEFGGRKHKIALKFYGFVSNFHGCLALAYGKTLAGTFYCKAMTIV